MKKLVIIGAGGMGRTMYDIARESIGYNDTFIIKGFIDDDVDSLKDFKNYPPLLGTISDYKPESEDVFVCSIGGSSRKRCINAIAEKGGEFISIIHNTSRILHNAVIGEGSVIGAFSTIGNDAEIGKHCLVQSYTVVGHDCRIGNYNRIDTHVTLVGGAQTEDEVTIYTSAVINQNVVCCEGSKIGALSFVIRNVSPNTTVMGNPAKTLK